MLQAKYLCLKKDLKGENNAKEISDKLPFIEYDLHRQLINKLKVKGMNGLFGLTTKLRYGHHQRTFDKLICIVGQIKYLLQGRTELTQSSPKLHVKCASDFPIG